MRPDDDLPPAEDVDRAELRGDLAADVLAVFDDEPDFAVRELPPLPLLPLEAVFDRADVVLRDEDDLELPLLDELLLDEPLLEPPLLLRDELLVLRPPPDDALPPLRPAALFCAVLPPRLDELLLLLRDELPLLELRPPLDEAFPPLRPTAERPRAAAALEIRAAFSLLSPSSRSFS